MIHIFTLSSLPWSSEITGNKNPKSGEIKTKGIFSKER